MRVDEFVCERVCVRTETLTYKRAQTQPKHTYNLTHSYEPHVYGSVFEYLCKDFCVWVCVCVFMSVCVYECVCVCVSVCLCL